MINRKKTLVVSLVLLLALVFSSCSLFGVKIKVTFDANEGKFSDDKSSYVIDTDGKSTVTLPDDPVRDGYAFDGWYFDKDVWEQPFTATTFKENPVSSDITIYAKWIKLYTITFESNGGSEVDPVITDGKSTVELPGPEKDDYDFGGWYFDNGTWEQPFTSDTLTENPITEDITLYARWVQYTITFNSNGGSEVNPVITDGKSTVALPEPEKDDYDFGGWYFDNGTWEQPFTSDTLIENPIKNNITVYAKWVQYEVTFDSNGGSEVAPIKKSSNSPIDVQAPTRQGYVFNGWYSDKELKTPISVVPNNDITVYAGWYTEGLLFTDIGQGYSVSNGTATSSNILLPPLYNGLPVKSIADEGFKNLNITGIFIPDSVTVIGKDAFRFCRYLASVTIPDSVTTIDEYAFYSCSALTTLIIPDSVTAINTRAFDGCSSLVYVRLSENLTTLKYGIFMNCFGLKTVTIPDKVTTIENDAFYNCNDLEAIIIPKNVNDIKFDVFGSSEKVTIYCESAQAPSWHDEWNTGRPYVLDCTCYKVTFDGNGGTEWGYVRTCQDIKVYLPPNPKREGYTFDGWYVDKDEWQQPFDENYTVTQDLTVYAKWVEAE